MYSLKKLAISQNTGNVTFEDMDPAHIMYFISTCDVRSEAKLFLFGRTSPAVFHGPDPSLLIRNWKTNSVTSHWPICSVMTDTAGDRPQTS